ncbi:MAG: glycine cleavage system aminomethyltransferase GcvT [Candidatus Nanopelagicales bacterium]|nr:glycine cleavage system aminomethyltransferase GcvT [Candidatus Nanopelagicales bacterium]
MSLRQTPLHSRHVALGAKMADFGGWDMPIEYVGTVTEHTAVRESAGVFDVSHMGYTEVTGSGAIAWLNSVLANDLERVGAGQAQYSLLCDESGGVIDDLIVYRINDDNAFIIPNASNSDAVVATLSAAAAAAGTGITVADKREDYGILAVQGPRSDAILEALGLPCGHDYMSFARTSWQGSPVVVCRTGYTGERGYEVLVPASVLADLWDAVVTAGATPAGLGARDTLRTEMGYPLHGHELSLDITPVQAGLAWAVGWDKPAFAGRDALAAERASGPRRRLRGLVAVERAIPRPGMPVLSADGATIGEMTSGTFSPTLKQGIGLALLDPAIAEGDEVVVDVRGRQARFTVTKPPFVPPHVR